MSVAAWNGKTLNKHEVQEIFPCWNYLSSDVSSALFVRASRKILSRNCCLSNWNFFFFSVCSYFCRHWVAALAQGWGGLQLPLGWDSFWKILCSIKDFPVTQIRGKAKYRCNISNSKHQQPVWDWISSRRCVCAMVGWLKVFIHTWRGQCVVEKEWNYSYFIWFCQPLTTLMLSALVGSFGVLPDDFFHSEQLIADCELWCGWKLLQVNAKQV